MSSQLQFETSDALFQAISPQKEMAAYETLWSDPNATFKRIADKFRDGGATPSDLVSEDQISSTWKQLQAIFKKYDVAKFGVRVHGTGEYPKYLRDAKNPVELLYYHGYWDLAFLPGVAIVGARKVSKEGIRRTKRLARLLADDGYAIVSGLAEGVDTAAHTVALQLETPTIAVMGTPLSHVYPKQNRELFETIKKNHLVISQIPFARYESQDYRRNRSFFPERNVTMSAMTKATVIIEASDTSGTLYQARAAIAQGRKLFILASCFENSDITWPARFVEKGAIKVSDFEQIREELRDDEADED